MPAENTIGSAQGVKNARLGPSSPGIVNFAISTAAINPAAKERNGREASICSEDEDELVEIPEAVAHFVAAGAPGGNMQQLHGS